MNIIGSGKLGRTLARLFYEAGHVQIGGIYNRNPESSQSALNFIGDGTISAALEVMPNADFWLIATPDDAIQDCSKQLAQLNKAWCNTIVFHTSGLKTSAELSALKSSGSAIASIHPAHSFANPEQSLSTFKNTVCALEGDTQALQKITPLLEAIHAQTTHIQPEAKALYHAATVIASNYLVTLNEVSNALLAKAGFNEQLSTAVLAPLMTQTLKNTLETGAKNALTGPIARGDQQTIKTHLEALKRDLPEYTGLYKTLGEKTLQLAKKQNNLSPEGIQALRNILDDQ